MNSSTSGEWPFVSRLLEAQAARHPGAVAVQGRDCHLTFRELDERAEGLARRLRALGVGPEVRVALALERSPELIVALLAVLKSGGAYVPLDPAYPRERLREMLERARPAVLVTNRAGVERLPAVNARWLLLDAPPSSDPERVGWVAPTSPPPQPSPAGRGGNDPTSGDPLAYIIFTSGSTGRPKGVCVPQRALAHHCARIAEEYELGPGDRVLQFATISFDVAAEEIFPALARGATVVLRTEEALGSIRGFLEYVARERITVLNIPASYWHEVVAELVPGGPASDRVPQNGNGTHALDPGGTPALPATLRLVIVGNERVSAAAYAQWRAVAGDRLRWLNAYGPTEATITATLFDPAREKFSPAGAATVPIGRPLAGVTAHVLDQEGQAVAAGGEGELFLGGAGVARGYLDDPEQTAAKFVPDPFSAAPGARLFRTGDRVRRMPDGNLEFLGRLDEQVKIRGFRVEPGEIEAALRAHPRVRQAAVVAREGPPGEVRLAAYIVGDVAPAVLRDFLEGRVPAQLMPAAITALPALPLTPQGKLDARALPAPEYASAAPMVAPGDEAEASLARIWCDVLRVSRVGVDDAFFELGGDSLQATRIVSRIRDVFAVELSLREFFEAPTVAGLARTLASRGGAAVTAPPLTRAPRAQPLPLSFAQQRLWFLDQLEPGGCAYNMPEAIRLKGPVQPAALEESLNEIIRRHEILRTTYAVREGQPVQVTAPSSRVSLPVIDLQDVAEGGREAEAFRRAREEAGHPFDLTRDSVLRARLLRLGDEDHLLVLILHHIAADAWSMMLLHEELVAGYERSLRQGGSKEAAPANSAPRENDRDRFGNAPFPLTPALSPGEREPAMQYADFAVWQRRWLEGAVREQQLDYWRRRLSGAAPVLELPADRPRPPVQTNRGAAWTVTLPRALCDVITAWSRREDVTPFTTVLAAFEALLHRSGGGDDLVIGTPVAGRNRVEVESLLGFFANTLVLRTDCSGRPTFRELVRRTRETTLGALAHQDLPFETLVEALQPDRDPGHSPLFQVMFAWQPAVVADRVYAAGGLEFHPCEFEAGISLFDLTLEILECAGGWRARLTYNTDLFEADTMQRMLRHFEHLLAAAIATPDERVARLPWLDAREVQALRSNPEWIVDAEGEPVPPGVVGEIAWPAGAGVPVAQSNIYTGEGAPGAVARRSGWLGRRRQSGPLEVLGRVARQARVRGRRVDLDEVERALRDEDSVADAAVVVRRDLRGSDHLVAGVVPRARFAPEALRERLARRLPAQAIPDAYIPLGALPRTVDGAVDDAALRGLEIIDERAREVWEEHLVKALGTRDVAVVVRTRRAERGAWHLADLLPGWSRGQARAAPAPEGKPVVVALEAGSRPSVAEGGPLEIPADAPATLVELLERAAAGAKGGLTYLSAAAPVEQSYAALFEEAQCILGGLRGQGLRAPDKVLLQCAEPRDFIAAFWACQLGGFVPVPLAVPAAQDADSAGARKLHQVWEACGKCRVISAGAAVGTLRALGFMPGTLLELEPLRAHAREAWRTDAAPGDVALLMPTSGSTGAPKLVPLTQRNLLARTLGSVRRNHFTADEVTLNWMPLDHVAGLVYFHLRDLFLRCRQLHAPTALVVEQPLRWLDWIGEFGVTITFAPNFAFGLVNDAVSGGSPGPGGAASRRWNLSSLRHVLNGAEPVVARTARTFLKQLAPHGLGPAVMRPAWGMAEVSSGVTYSDSFTLEGTSDDDPWVEVGAPIPGVALRIVDAAGAVVSEGTAGRLQVRGATVMAGYFGDTGAGADAVAPGGWFDTGDRGFLRDGRLTVTGREKDVIIVRGVNFPAHEIEAVIEEVPGVRRSFTAACATRLAQAETDELAVFVVPADGNDDQVRRTLREIRAQVAQKVGVPPAWVVPLAAEAVPKTSLGKIQRAVLRDRLEGGGFEPELRWAEVLLRQANTLPDWFHRRVWRPRPLSAAARAQVELDRSGLRGGAATGDATILVLGGRPGEGPADAVRVEAGDVFARLGARRFRLHPERPEDFRQLVQAMRDEGIRIGTVVWCWTLENPPALSGLLGLARAWAGENTGPAARTKLIVVARGAQAVRAGEVPEVTLAGIPVLLKVLSQEVPGLEARLIDVDREDAREEMLAGELAEPGVETEVAYRGGQRFVCGIERIDFATKTRRAPSFERGGLYLISGGAGGIGRVLTERLLAEFDARVLWIGRSPVPSGSPSDAVACEVADVADGVAVRRAVARARARFGRRLAGAIHLAGSALARSLLEETPETLAELVRTKLEGARVLEAILREEGGGLLVAFSSVNSFFGGAGLGAYAVANRMLESFMAAPGDPSVRRVCVAWSLWDGLGMNRTFAGNEAAREHGFEAISAGAGWQSLGAVLHADASDVLIGLDGTHPFVRRHGGDTGAAPLLELCAVTETGRRAAVERAVREATCVDAFGTRMSCEVEGVASLPRTVAGEVDRARLAGEAARARRAPDTATERRLAELWFEVLGVRPAEADADFFALGGHSLRATQLMSRVREAFRVELPLQIVFQWPTVGGLAAQIDQALPQQAPAMERTPIKRAARQGEFALSFAQERLWFFDQLVPDQAFYNIPVAVRLRGRLDRAALEKSFQEIIRRHETLRTTFRVAHDVPVQAVAQDAPLSCEVTEVGAAPGALREARLRELMVEEAARPFDLARGPLLRVRLFQLAADEHLLLITLHHIISDGWSQGVLVRELGTLYEACTGGRPVCLPEMRIQYADYAQWQRQAMQGRLLEEQLEYWKTQLAGELPVLDLPTDRPRPAVQSFRGATHTFVVAAPVVEDLKRLSQREGATLFMPLLAAFQSLLARYTGLEDILVGTPIANRNRVELEGLIGFLANTVVLRTSLAGNPPFHELVQRAKQTALGAYSHQDLPFEKLVEALNPHRDLARPPLFQVMFVWQNAPMPEMKLAGLSLQPVDLDIGVSLFDVTLYLEETAAGVKGILEYNTDLFDAGTMERLAGHYVTLLGAAAADPSQRVMQLPMLTAPERRQVVVEWNQTATTYPRDRCVHELFEEQAAQRPEAVALVFGEQQVSYGELNRRANQLARHLEQLGVGPETPVGLAAERSVDLIVGLLGILKAGAAYVPLDAGYPKARIEFMLADARVSVLVTLEKCLGRLPGFSGKIVCLDRDAAVLAQMPAENPGVRARAEGPAYLMYTSGSTGQPKGVSIPHRGIVRLVRGADYASFGPDEVFLQLAPISFDASTLEIWGALLNGGRLVVMPPETPTLEDLGVALRWHGVTTLWLTADLFHLMVEERLEDLKGVRQLIAGGDVLSVSHVQRALEARGSLKLINGYGPTESTTFACCHRMDRTTVLARSVPIGRPISNTQVYLLDPWLQPVPVGVPGELCLGGDGLARGYWQQAELTEKKFLMNPLPEASGARLYRTGDRARFRSDGVIEFLGRRDRQMKVRGFRVELAEVEAAMRQHPNLKQLVVLASGEEPRCLVGYFVPRELPAPTAGELREFLLGKLPEQLVPAMFVPLEALPLTPAGKLDALALAARGGPRASADEAVAPHDLLEVQLKHIWERVLGLRAISVRENFFDLGGHSLLAVKLFSQIEKVTGKHLPLATLFEAPTIEQLGRVLKHEGWTASWSSLVSIQPGGTRRPFFIIHGVGGNVLNFHDLARHLGEDQPVYGLQSRGLDRKLPPVTRIEDMAAHYIREIRSIQPAGPYALGGMSFGGVVSYEMARQLAAAGEKVALLALLDSYALGHSELIPITERYRREMGVLTRRVKMHWRNLFDAPPGGRVRYLRAKAKTLRRRVLSRLWQLLYKVLSKSGRSLPPALLSVKEANFMAAKDYVTKPYSGRVTLFVASEQPIEGDPRDVWSHLALGGVEVHQIPGDHVTLLEEPNVAVLAERLSACLRSTTDAPA